MSNYPDTTWEYDPHAPWNEGCEEEEPRDYESECIIAGEAEMDWARERAMLND